MKYAQNDNGQPVNVKHESEQIILPNGDIHPGSLAQWSDEKIARILEYYPYNESTDKANELEDEVRTWVFDGDKFDENVVTTAKPQTELDAIKATLLAARQDDAQEQLQNNDIIRAVVMAINDGALVTGANLSGSALKQIIRDHIK